MKAIKYLFLFTLYLSVIYSVQALPEPSNITFTDYSQNNYDVLVCDIRNNTENCTRYNALDIIELQTNRDYYLKLTPNQLDIYLTAKENILNSDTLELLIFLIFIFTSISLIIHHYY